MLQGLDDYLNEEKVQQIAALGHNPNMEELEVILSRRIRSEKVAIKDIKLRTFIAEGNSRNDLAAHVYDITYGSLVSGVDNLVIIDDSIVRGTTLKQKYYRYSRPSWSEEDCYRFFFSPQVRYPEYYGIDMAKMSEFIAFQSCCRIAERAGYERYNCVCLPEIQRSDRFAERANGELCKKKYMHLSRMRKSPPKW